MPLPLLAAVLFAVLVILNLLDVWTTVQVLSHGGKEVNPFERFFIQRLKLTPGLLVAKGVMLVAAGAAVLYLLHGGAGVLAVAMLVAMVSLYLWVVAHNFGQMKHQQSR